MLEREGKKPKREKGVLKLDFVRAGEQNFCIETEVGLLNTVGDRQLLTDLIGHKQLTQVIATTNQRPCTGIWSPSTGQDSKGQSDMATYM